MDQMAITKQMMGFQKMTFDNMFGNILLCLDSSEMISRSLLDQATWLPEEGKKAMLEWVRSSRKGIEQLKQAVDEGFNRMDQLVTSTGVRMP